MKGLKLGLFLVAVAVVAVFGYFGYMAWAFPASRCEGAKHLAAGQMEGDCYGCHVKATPAQAQYWLESKHGLTLVRCQTCHGMPDGQGSLQFTRSPSVETCARCHSAAMKVMEAKFGRRGDCSTCHPFHQSAMHGSPYQYRLPTAQTSF